MQNVTTFLTYNVITQNVIQLSRYEESKACSINAYVYSSVIKQMIGRVQGYQICIKGTGESHKLFGDKILSKNSPYQPTNFSYFLKRSHNVSP